MIQGILVPILIPLSCGIRCFPGLRMGLSPCNPVELSRDPAPPKTPGLLLALPPRAFCWKGTSGFVFSAAVGAVWGRAVAVPFGSGRCLFLLALLRAAAGTSPLPQHRRGAGESGEQGHLASKSVGSTGQ